MAATSYTFKGLLTENGWIPNAVVDLDASGNVISISESEISRGEFVNGYAFPGFQNAHSHAFQYAMAGLAELHVDTAIQDDFWSWRNAMYGLALTLSPDQLEVVATMLYSEMARHGYTAVAEFHTCTTIKMVNPTPTSPKWAKGLLLRPKRLASALHWFLSFTSREGLERRRLSVKNGSFPTR